MLVNDLRSIVSKASAAKRRTLLPVRFPTLVERNWRIGQRIVEEEQNGATRTQYGKHLI